MFLATPIGDRTEERTVKGRVWQRHRQRIRLMQAAIDSHDQAEAPHKAKPPFIEPAHLRAGFDMSGDPVRNLAIAIDPLLMRSSRASTL
jgi:hypothetical protein